MRLIALLISNALALATTSYLVHGFEISPDLKGFALATVVFTIINIFIRPVLKFILSPIILLTLGLGILIVNGITLYLLDIFSKNITINGITAFIYATLIISVFNIFIAIEKKALRKRPAN